MFEGGRSRLKSQVRCTEYRVQSQKRSAVGSNASGLYSPQPSRIHDATLRLKSDLRLDCKNVKLKEKKEMEK